MVSYSNIMNGNILKLSMGLFLIGTLMMSLVTKLRKLFSKNKTQAIVYALFILITFALTGLLSSSKVLNDTPLNSFFGFQLILFILGGVHVYVLRTFFEDLSEDKSDFIHEFLFTLAYICIGLIAFANVTSRLKPSFSLLFLASTITFFIPLLMYKLYEFALLIPAPIFKQWFFPAENISEPTDRELKNPLVIGFEFPKKEGDHEITNFRLKAPEKMEFGKLFYFFINDYNERHPESKIAYINSKTNEPFGWMFYIKPNWWSTMKHVDFSKTVNGNNIAEDALIICKRAQ